MSPSSRSPTSSPGSPGPCSQAGARSKLKRPPRPERRTDIARHVAPHNSPRLRAGTRRDGLAVDRRPENLGGSMSCRRRRIYEDRDARISILAPGNTASEMRPDTLPQTVHPPSTIPLHTRGGPYIEPASFRMISPMRLRSSTCNCAGICGSRHGGGSRRALRGSPQSDFGGARSGGAASRGSCWTTRRERSIPGASTPSTPASRWR